MPKALHIDARDNVAVCTREALPGETVEVIEPDGKRTFIEASERIPFCNKIALRDIACGSPVVKYGEEIGVATATIAMGCLANDRNISSRQRSYAEEYIAKEGAA